MLNNITSTKKLKQKSLPLSLPIKLKRTKRNLRIKLSPHLIEYRAYHYDMKGKIHSFWNFYVRVFSNVWHPRHMFHERAHQSSAGNHSRRISRRLLPSVSRNRRLDITNINESNSNKNWRNSSDLPTTFIQDSQENDAGKNQNTEKVLPPIQREEQHHYQLHGHLWLCVQPP